MDTLQGNCIFLSMTVHSDVLKYYIPQYIAQDANVKALIDAFKANSFTDRLYDYELNYNMCLYDLIDDMAKYSLEVENDQKPCDCLNSCCNQEAPFVILGELLYKNLDMYHWFKLKYGLKNHRFIYMEICMQALKSLQVEKIMWLINELDTDFEYQGACWMENWYLDALELNYREIDARLSKVYFKLRKIGISKDDLIDSLKFQELKLTELPETMIVIHTVYLK
jgi:hypothetical protein